MKYSPALEDANHLENAIKKPFSLEVVLEVRRAELSEPPTDNP